MTDNDLSEADDFVQDCTNIDLQDKESVIEVDFREHEDRMKVLKLLLRSMIAEGDIQEHIEAKKWDEMFFQESVQDSMDDEDLRRPEREPETVECSECGRHYEQAPYKRIFHETGQCQHLKEALSASREELEEQISDREIDPEEEIRSIREQEKFAANTKALRKSFKAETPPHLLCDNCGFDIDAWKFWETVILEQIEFQKSMGSDHLLDQIEKTHEVFLAECPECGEVSDFRGDNA